MEEVCQSCQFRSIAIVESETEWKKFARVASSEVLQLLNQKLNGRSLPELPVQEKKQLLKEMKQHPSVSQRQLARITGIGFNVIRRL